MVILRPLRGQGWTVDAFGQIRNSSLQCPLVALYHHRTDDPYRVNVRTAVKRLDIDNRLAAHIITAADNPNDELRQEMIKELEVQPLTSTYWDRILREIDPTQQF